MSRRDLVTVSGPDTWTFLQSLLSQDLDGLVEGERRVTLMLTPQGKVDVLAGITRNGDDAVLDTEPGFGDQLVASLTRFKIRTKVEFAVTAAPELDAAGLAENTLVLFLTDRGEAFGEWGLYFDHHTVADAVTRCALISRRAVTW